MIIRCLPQLSRTPSILLDLPPHLLILGKPSGLSAHPSTSTHEPSLITDAKSHVLKTRNTNYATLIGRLDKSVSGVSIIATSKKAARRLSLLQSTRDPSIIKTYHAIVDLPSAKHNLKLNKPRTLTSVLHPPFDKAPIKLTAASNPLQHNTKLCSLTFTPLLISSKNALLAVNLHTGRKHQIRAQLAAINHPISRDNIYNPSVLPTKTNTLTQIPLHCERISFDHPVANTSHGRVDVSAPHPAWWKNTWPKLFDAKDNSKGDGDN